MYQRKTKARKEIIPMSDDVKETLQEEVNKPVTEAETGEAVENGGNVEASGFTRRRGLLTEFHVFELQPNLSGAASIPLTSTPKVIASLDGPRAFHIDDPKDRIWLTGTVGWQAITNGTGGKVDVLFKIFRNSPDQLIFSTRDSAEADEDNFRTTSFTHVDLTPPGGCDDPPGQTVSYFLTAELPLEGSAATVIGPTTFTGAEIACNRPFC